MNKLLLTALLLTIAPGFSKATASADIPGSACRSNRHLQPVCDGTLPQPLPHAGWKSAYWAPPPRETQTQPRPDAAGSFSEEPAQEAQRQNDERQLEETRARLQQLQEALEQMRADLDSVRDREQQALEQQRLLRDVLAAERAERQASLARIAELSGRLEAATSALGQQQAQAQALGTELESLRAALADRDARLRELDTRIQDSTAALQEQQAPPAAEKHDETRSGDASTGGEMAALERSGGDALPAAAAGPVAATPADGDGDGVEDSLDLCPETRTGVVVDDTGCAANTPINLTGVTFYYDSHQLTARARASLDRVAAVLDRRRDLNMEIAGHTDTQGDPRYNQWLSRKRAEAVKAYLVSRGLDAERFTARGYGDRQPLAANTTRAGLRANRRVELRRLP